MPKPKTKTKKTIVNTLTSKPVSTLNRKIEIYYLVHVTKESHYKKIYKSQILKVSQGFNDQFPGVYFSLVTSRNIDNELFFPGNKILIFSPKLLEQRNYHVNIQDHNGIISEKNTFFHWNLKSNLSKFMVDPRNKNWDYSSNEVVFHDDVPLSYLCQTIERSPDKRINDLLPRKVISNKIPPNKKLLPFFNYCDYKIYTGMKTNYSNASSLLWFKMLAKVFNVSDDGTITDILKRMKSKQEELYRNRHLQDIHHLIIFTANKSHNSLRSN